MTSPAREDQPSPAASPSIPVDLQALRWCLVASFAAMCVGAGWRALVEGDAVVSYLFINRDWDEESALAVAWVSGYALLAAPALIWWRRGWPVLFAVGLWMAMVAFMSTEQRLLGWKLVPGEESVRFLGPIATGILVVSLARGISPRREDLLVGILRFAAAMTFLFHGVAALQAHPKFLDLIFMGARRVLDVQVEESTAVVLLRVIGVQDVLLAGLLLSPFRGLRTGAAAYMAVWGLLTAASRTLHSGWGVAYQTLLRVPNGGVPLALFLYWWIRRRRSTLDG